MTRRATVLFYLVLGGHAVSIFIVALSIGTFIPAQSQGEIAVNALINVIAAGVQIVAFYVVASESAQVGRWGVAFIMMSLTLISMILAIAFGSNASYYITTGDLVVTILAAAISCGTLIWLRRKPVSK